MLQIPSLVIPTTGTETPAGENTAGQDLFSMFLTQTLVEPSSVVKGGPNQMGLSEIDPEGGPSETNPRVSNEIAKDKRDERDPFFPLEPDMSGLFAASLPPNVFSEIEPHRLMEKPEISSATENTPIRLAEDSEQPHTIEKLESEFSAKVLALEVFEDKLPVVNPTSREQTFQPLLQRKVAVPLEASKDWKAEVSSGPLFASAEAEISPSIPEREKQERLPRTHEQSAFSLAPAQALPREAVMVSPTDAAPAPTAPKEIEQKITQLAGQGGGRMTIALHPPELGKVEVEVMARGRKVEVKMTSDSVAAKEAIQSGLSDLRSALAQNQMELTKADVKWSGEAALGTLSGGASGFAQSNPSSMQSDRGEANSRFGFLAAEEPSLRIGNSTASSTELDTDTRRLNLRI
jgi:hypothetical protein